MKGRKRNLFSALATASVPFVGAGGVLYAKSLPLEPYSVISPAKPDLGSMIRLGSHVFTPMRITSTIPCPNVNVNLKLDIETSFNDLSGTYTGTLNTYGDANALTGEIP